MSTLIGCGISNKLDSFSAGRDAAESAYLKVKNRPSDIIIVFISSIFEQENVIRGIRSVITDGYLIGCSSDGIITREGLFRNSVGVFTFYSNTLSFSPGLGKALKRNSRLAGSEATKMALSKVASDRKKQAFIIFSDGITGNGSDILRGIQELLGTGFPIIGGAASDELHFQKSYQYLNHVYNDSVAGFLISGDINVSIGTAHGWLPIGKPHKITKARANTIKELDKKPAYTVYEEYLEKKIDDLKELRRFGINYPFGIKIKETNEYLIRVPVELDEDGGLILNGNVPEDEDVYLMIGNKDAALKMTKSVCEKISKEISRYSNIEFLIVISNIARYRLLRIDAQKELDIIKDSFGEDIPIIGFYSYGEYASPQIYESIKWFDFQNHTITIAAFCE